MAIDEALELMRRTVDRPVNGVTWSPREQAERAVLAELDRLREIEQLAREYVEAPEPADLGDDPLRRQLVRLLGLPPDVA